MTDKISSEDFIKAFGSGTKEHSTDGKFYYNHGYKQAERDLKRPQGECKTCRHRDPEDKKCDCGALERAGCPFPVSDDYFCKFYEKGGAE